MKIVTNPGSNLDDALIQHYGIHITPQQIVVDGVTHDTRLPISHDDVDHWVSTAKEFPYVIGTTAPEFVSTFSTLLKGDPEILAVMTSKKLIKSFAAAETAARTVLAASKVPKARIAVLDSGLTDVGAGLVTIAMAEAAQAGLSIDRAMRLGEAVTAKAKLLWMLDALDYARKGGRSGWLRTWLATMLDIKPLVGFVDGEPKSIGRISSKDDAAKSIAAALGQQVGAGKRVWVGVLHGKAPEKAAKVVLELSKVFDVTWSYLRPLAGSIYVHCGPGCVGAAVLPIDDLPWDLPARPSCA